MINRKRFSITYFKRESWDKASYYKKNVEEQNTTWDTGQLLSEILKRFYDLKNVHGYSRTRLIFTLDFP